MKRARLIALLLLLNLALASVAGYLAWHRRSLVASPPPEALHEPAVVIQETQMVTVVVSNDFRWTQLESEDYRTYIARLRSIGCPEQTIRDLIIADIDKLL